MKQMQRKLKFVFLGIFVLFAILVLPVLRYHTEPNLNALPSRFVKGVYHVHSTFSDGSGEISEIAAAAEALKLDFVILTDHGEPNAASLGSTAWHGRTLLIGGTELSLNSGHLAAFGFPIPPQPLPPEPDEAIADITRMGGLTFISHPFDKAIPWTDWRVSGFSGLEILSSYSSARNASFLNLLTLPVRYLFNQKYALLQTLSYPVKNMKKWDDLNLSGRYSGIFALDAHGRLPISAKSRLPFPSYRSMFAILNVYVRIDRELIRNAQASAGIVADAIGKGHFFNVIEAIAPANGFDIRFIPAADAAGVTQMGDFCPWSAGRLEVDLPFTFETRLRLIRNGTLHAERLSSMKHRVSFQIEEPGSYRLEVFIPGNHFSTIPWIVTNPFFLGTVAKASGAGPPRQRFSAIPLPAKGDFVAESNPESSCRIIASPADEGNLVLEYRLLTPADAADGWCAAAMRKGIDLSAFSGVAFDARAASPSRHWFELRSGDETAESWFRRSFASSLEWSPVEIPFHRLFRYSGNQAIDLTRVRSLFVSVTNRLAFSGTSGRLELRNFRLIAPTRVSSQGD